MARRIYWIILVLTLIAGITLFVCKDDFTRTSLFVSLFFLLMALSAGVHGVIAHSLNPQLKGGLIAYPLFMGLLFAALFLICILYILPLFYPAFK